MASENPNDADAPVGFLEPWFWNYFLSALQYFGSVGCEGLGMFGLFWWNDGGLMMNRCFLLTKGVVVQYESAAE